MQNIPIIIIALLILAGIGYVVRENNVGGNTKDLVVREMGSDTAVDPGLVLNLSSRGLTAVPMDIFSKTSLEELNLSNNNLEGALQAEVRHLQRLKVLNLSHNKFTGVPAEVGQLKNLEVLNLSDNLLTGLPYEIGKLSKLKVLDVSGNEYSEADLLTIRKNLPSSVLVKTK